ncbi:hypothetical protein JW613_30685 [Streptomyces smyrnaeus]|uniref:DOD-type homing endonuclease domain-containing protein n=1 Tax=Streptomyces smyrnaeus TaxID=1387713 RepID=A0ABS3Y4N1_9ACTN|nr:hypothetical protein [Streptomyces smyrnaeus]
MAVGDRLRTLEGSSSTRSVVSSVTVRKERELVTVITDHTEFDAAPDQPLSTSNGWVPAAEVAGARLAWTPARKLHRRRLTVVPGYPLGYFVGATCADGTVGHNYVSLVVNDGAFAARYAESLRAAVGLPARLEAVTRPSGYLQRDVPGFRVRVVSSYLADLVRQYVGGDPHHLRQAFPRVVLRDRETFDGFLDGYADGDGCRMPRWRGRTLVSANVPFLRELASVIGARFTPASQGLASHLCVIDRWADRGTFVPEQHPLPLDEREWVRVRAVRPRRASGAKPFTLYGFRLQPHRHFLVNGHLCGAV